MMTLHKFAALTGLAVTLSACDTATSQTGGTDTAMERGNLAVAECAATQCTRLDLDGARLADYSVLGSMTHVKALMISYTDFDDLSDIAAMSQLEELHIGQTDVTDLSGLAAFPDLRVLHAQYLRDDIDYAPVTRLSSLTELAIGDYAFDEVSVIAALPQLRELVMYASWQTDLSPLRAHPGLEVVDFGDTGVEDITVLTTLPRLRKLSVADLGDEAMSAPVIATLTARGVEVTETPVVIVC